MLGIGGESEIQPRGAETQTRGYGRFRSDRNKEDGLSYTIPRLSTRTINPSLADIRAIFAEQQVQGAIRDSAFTANLYLIVGADRTRC